MIGSETHRLELLKRLEKLQKRTLLDRLGEVALENPATKEEFAERLTEIGYRDKMDELTLIEHLYYLENLDVFDPEMTVCDAGN